MVLLLLAAGGPAKAAELLGLTAPVANGGDTAKIVVFDTALGIPTVLADTGLGTFSPGPSANSIFGPNALAYDPPRGRALFATVPNDGSAPMLYGQVIDPVTGPPMLLGPLADGVVPTNATFYANLYWYIDSGTDDLRSVSFELDGSMDMDVKVTDLGMGDLSFGDCSVDQATGEMFCSADNSTKAAGETVIFRVDLDDTPPIYEELLVTTDAILQLAHGGEGTLFGHNGVEDSLYYISLIAPIGARAKVLDPADGISGLGFMGFTDFSTFNPLCECERDPLERVCNCDGGLIRLLLEFTGDPMTLVMIQADGQGQDILFGPATIDTGFEIELLGELNKGRIHNGLNLFEGGVQTGFLHTSCSDPVGPGVSSANFLVLEATNKFDEEVVCEGPPLNDN